MPKDDSHGLLLHLRINSYNIIFLFDIPLSALFFRNSDYTFYHYELRSSGEEEMMANSSNRGGAAASGGIYGLGFIGAVVYFIGHAATFWAGVAGFFKALVWPAFLVYELMKQLQM